MKNLIWVVLAAVVLGGGYMVYSNKTAEKAAMAQAEADKAAEAAKLAEAAEAEAAKVEEEEAAAAKLEEEAAGGLADLLTPEGFNLDKVGEIIDGSELGALKKIALKTALDSAKDNPELLNSVLEQIKGTLGM